MPLAWVVTACAAAAPLPSPLAEINPGATAASITELCTPPPGAEMSGPPDRDSRYPGSAR